MGIDNVAMKTFNSTGSQSVCRANEPDDTKLIESEFLTKCTTNYMNGSGMSFIAGFNGVLTNFKQETFDLPSDVDAISNITLHMSVSGYDSGGTRKISPTFILDLISKIEVKIGNLTTQTIYPGDIFARNITEFGNLLTQKFPEGDFSLNIPFTGRGKNLTRSFLQAGAVTNNITLKFTYNYITATAPPLITYSEGTPTISTGLCVFTHQITNTEKNFIAKNIINRVVNTSQGLQISSSLAAASGSQTVTLSSSAPLTIDLSSININVSHILLSLNVSQFNATLTDAAGAENSISGGSTWSVDVNAASEQANYTAMGIIPSWLKSVELILGNDRTGNIPGTCLVTDNTDLAEFYDAASRDGIYLIKTAGNSFSTAGIPFSRLNNKKLVVHFNDMTFKLAGAADGAGTPGKAYINVTCSGTQIQSTVGGSTSFSA